MNAGKEQVMRWEKPQYDVAGLYDLSGIAAHIHRLLGLKKASEIDPFGSTPFSLQMGSKDAQRLWGFSEVTLPVTWLIHYPACALSFTCS